jgi:nitroimidazol reductase NimA-like FMN-containing flavoprotein (pyridoxamine 5'-phosphate oxidase superfamily)
MRKDHAEFIAARVPDQEMTRDQAERITGRCEYCHSQLNFNGCYRCGAPVCCPMCCWRDTESAIAAAKAAGFAQERKDGE